MGGVFGQQGMASGNTPFNEMSFVVQMMLAKLNVATLVKVVAVHTAGRTAAVGTVDVLPLVNQVAGDGSAVPHTTIHGLPFFRLQGGANAVICDPKPGDIGFCVFADRDISSVQASGAQGNPGSARRFDMADGLYFGGWNMAESPAHYIVVDDAGISIEAGAAADLHATTFTINANVVLNGTLQVSGAATLQSTMEVDGAVTAKATVLAQGAITGQAGMAITGTSTCTGDLHTTGTLTADTEVKSGSHTLTAHTHTGVQTGGGSTGGPVG